MGTSLSRVPFSPKKVPVYLPYRRATSEIGAKQRVAHIPMTNCGVGLEERAGQGYEKKSQLLKNHHAII